MRQPAVKWIRGAWACTALTGASTPTPCATCWALTSTRRAAAAMTMNVTASTTSRRAAGVAVVRDQYLAAAQTVTALAIGNRHALPAATTYAAKEPARSASIVMACRSARAAASSSNTTSPPTANTSSRSATWRSRASAADGVREHGDRAARRQGVLSHHHRRRSRPQGDRPAAGSGGRRDQRAAAEDPLPRHGRAAQAGDHLRARSFAESDERACAPSRSRVVRSASRPRMRCEIRGPLAVTGMSESASRAKIFICYPASRRSAGHRAACAQRIVTRTSRGAPSGVR